jgi:hypothetical protein
MNRNMTPEVSHSRGGSKAKAAPLSSILGEPPEPEPPHRTRAAIGYSRVCVYVILSLCAMWDMAFVAAHTGGSWHGGAVPSVMIRLPKAPSDARDTVVTRRVNEIVLSALPTFAMKRGRHRLRNSIWNKKGIAFAAPASPTTTTSNDNTDPELRSRLAKMLENGPLHLLGEDTLSIIADTGCTMASSFDPLDFEGPIIPIYPVTRMQGIIGATVEIRGRGTIKWTVIDDSGTTRVIRTQGFYVPGMNVRLLSPQAYMRDPESTCDEFRLSAHAATLSWSNASMSDCDLHVHTLTIPYDDVTALPCMRAYRNLKESAEAVATGASFFSVTDAYLHSVEDHAETTRFVDEVACATYNAPCAAAATLDGQEDWWAWMHAWRSGHETVNRESV